ILGSLGGHSPFNWFTYEKAAKDLYWHIWRADTRDMLHCYLIDKPREIVDVLVAASSPDRRFTRDNPGLGFRPLAPAPLLLAFAVSAHFAPRGFRGGFTDMAHDGYQLRQVMDLDRGGTIFKDTFEQYGPLAGYLNLFAYRLLGRNLLAVKYGICAWYAAASVLLYVLARSLLTPAFSLVAVVLWLVLAPFY